MFLGEKYIPLLKKPLKDRNVNICSLKGDNRLDERVREHTDMLVFHFGGDTFIFTQKQPFIDANIIISDSNIRSNYPYDIVLNAVRIGNLLICNKKHTDKSIIEYAENNEITIIDVKQGYSKCSVAPITNNALITDDRGIYESASEYGIDVLYINKRFVICEGYDYGFIGGACGMINKNVLTFTGVFTDEYIKSQVELFAQKYNIRTEYLTNMPMFDVGSIIPITEER